MSLKEAVSSNLLPAKLSISKAFDVEKKNVSVELSYDRSSQTAAFNVSIRDAYKSLTFAQVTAIHEDSVECRIFGTRAMVCTLDPKMPPCFGCKLAGDYKPTTTT